MLKKAVVLSIFVETVIHFFIIIFLQAPPPHPRKESCWQILLSS